MSLLKKEKFKSKKYLDWVRVQPCMITGYPLCDPHHLKGHGFSGGTKATDLAIIPLYHLTHDNLHNIGYKQWEANNKCQLELLIEFIGSNFDEISGIVGSYILSDFFDEIKELHGLENAN